VRYRVVASGLVQGVWFRESCRREAAVRGVAGWVANRFDGRVEAVFEGPEPVVAEMVAWCRMGPARAEVTGLEVHQESPQGLAGFSVR
jgi:acylphosphatase